MSNAVCGDMLEQGKLPLGSAETEIVTPWLLQTWVFSLVMKSNASVAGCRREQGEGSGGDSGSHRGGYQAFSSMVFAQGGVPQQHVTANDMPSPETDVQRNDLAPDASLSLTDEDQGGGLGSLTGWQALANEVVSQPFMLLLWSVTFLHSQTGVCILRISC